MGGRRYTDYADLTDASRTDNSFLNTKGYEGNEINTHEGKSFVYPSCDFVFKGFSPHFSAAERLLMELRKLLDF